MKKLKITFVVLLCLAIIAYVFKVCFNLIDHEYKDNLFYAAQSIYRLLVFAAIIVFVIIVSKKQSTKTNNQGIQNNKILELIDDSPMSNVIKDIYKNNNLEFNRYKNQYNIYISLNKNEDNVELKISYMSNSFKKVIQLCNCSDSYLIIDNEKINANDKSYNEIINLIITNIKKNKSLSIFQKIDNAIKKESREPFDIKVNEIEIYLLIIAWFSFCIVFFISYITKIYPLIEEKPFTFSLIYNELKIACIISMVLVSISLIIGAIKLVKGVIKRNINSVSLIAFFASIISILILIHGLLITMGVKL